MGGGTRKQYLSLGNHSILDEILSRFNAWEWVSGIAVVLPPEDVPQFQSLRSRFSRVVAVCAGGATRFHSVKNGVAALSAASEDWVAVHDAARPLLSKTLAEKVLQSAKVHGAAIAALPLVGTIKRDDGRDDGVLAIRETVDRSSLWEAQTPQVFSYGGILAAYDALEKRGDFLTPTALARYTDEAMLFEALGKTVALVCGEARNLKVTRPEDVRIAMTWLQAECEEKS